MVVRRKARIVSSKKHFAKHGKVYRKGVSVKSFKKKQTSLRSVLSTRGKAVPKKILSIGEKSRLRQMEIKKKLAGMAKRELSSVKYTGKTSKLIARHQTPSKQLEKTKEISSIFGRSREYVKGALSRAGKIAENLPVVGTGTKKLILSGYGFAKGFLGVKTGVSEKVENVKDWVGSIVTGASEKVADVYENVGGTYEDYKEKREKKSMIRKLVIGAIALFIGAILYKKVK